MSSTENNSEVAVENVTTNEKAAEAKEIKGTKRPAEVSFSYKFYFNIPVDFRFSFIFVRNFFSLRKSRFCA